jgi:hypothetical protein
VRGQLEESSEAPHPTNVDWELTNVGLELGVMMADWNENDIPSPEQTNKRQASSVLEQAVIYKNILYIDILSELTTSKDLLWLTGR